MSQTRLSPSGPFLALGEAVFNEASGSTTLPTGTPTTILGVSAAALKRGQIVLLSGFCSINNAGGGPTVELQIEANGLPVGRSALIEPLSAAAGENVSLAGLIYAVPASGDYTFTLVGISQTAPATALNPHLSAIWFGN